MSKVRQLTLWPTLLCLVGNPVPKLTTSIDQITSSISSSCRIFGTSKVSFRDFFCEPSAWIGVWRLLRRGSFRFYRRWWLNKWTLFALVVLEKSHFMMMRTGGSRCLARYPYLAPAPRAATVSPCGGSSSTPLWPIKRQSGELFKHQKDVGKPTQSLPVRTGARLFD